MPRNERIALLGIGEFRYPSGISRTVQTIVDYFGDKTIVVTDDLSALRSHRIQKASVYKVNLSEQKALLKLLVDFAPLLVSLVRILRSERATRICVNSMHQFRRLLPVVAAATLLLRNVKVTIIVYDYEELRWFKANTPLKLLMFLGTITDFVVLNREIQILVERFAGPRRVHLMRLGVASVLLRLAEKSMDSIIEKVRPELLRQAQKDNECVKILFTGILIARRRIEDLITALSLLKEKEISSRRVVAYIAGSAGDNEEYKMRLLDLSKRLNCVDEIRFVKTLSEEELAYLYRSADIYVFPSVRQSWGLAPLEAMVFGKPVIVSDGSGVTEVLANKNVAVIIPARDPKELAGNLEDLIADDQKRRTIGRAGETYVRKYLTYRETGTQLENAWSK